MQLCLESLTLSYSNFESLFDSDMPCSKAKTTDKNTDAQITGLYGRCTMVEVLKIENRVHIFLNDTQG